MVKFGGEIGTLYQIFTPCTPLPKYKRAFTWFLGGSNSLPGCRRIYKCSFDINGNGVPCGMHFKNPKELNKHKVDAKHIKKKKADGDKEGENNEVEAVAE